ncbi:Sulfite reductase [ferredoxin] 2 [Geodia barretti]|uniref:Ferredoxin--nitrite reductase, chloroplastic n=1 Tax=Geodia barretti TaxID=519541 RepID=A0AA35W4Y8_GEOBA|nr:Sulfite reductase [ferredoxin] 2 [Geodia barretti]
MTQTEWKPRTQGILEILPEEISDFETQVARFRAGEWSENDFMAFRLRQGVYGQRQMDAQMFRIKCPFGGLNADQMDALGVLADEYAPLKKGHVTTRENFQFHHIRLEDGPAIMRLLGDVGLSTREACGNTVRNVTGCAIAGVCANEPFDVTPYAAAYARYFVRHPFSQALPRKVKSAFSGCDNDCAITPIHDVGFLPRIQDGKKGFKMVVGGGTSIMPRIAPTLYEFIPVEEYLKATEALLRIFHRTNELRRNRMKARIKFYIARIGIDEFKKELEEEIQQPWAQRSFDPTDLMFVEDESVDAPPLDGNYAAFGSDPEFEHWMNSNVESQRQDGYKAVTVRLPLGDIDGRQFHQLADMSRKYAGGRARITHQQNLTFRWVPENALYEVWQRLSDIGFGGAGAHEITDIVSCPGTDSCKLGITSSMGLGRALTDAVEHVDKSDPLVRQMHVKMSGCPNGCGQHHIADIGFHGAAAKGPGGQVPAYELFLGGSYSQDDPRFGQRIKAKIPAKRAPEALKRIVSDYQDSHGDGELFKDYVLRQGKDYFETMLGDFRELPDLNRETLEQYIDWDKTVKYVLERGEGECAV